MGLNETAFQARQDEISNRAKKSEEARLEAMLTNMARLKKLRLERDAKSNGATPTAA